MCQRRVVFALLLACSVVFLQAQKMEDVFVKMPDEFIVQLEEAWRKDLVDLYKSGKAANLENTMQGRSVLQQLTDDYLFLQLTEKSTVELKLLPLVNNTYILCMIETVYAPVADSRVSFYTTEWEPLPVADLFEPVDGEWFLTTDADRLSSEWQDATSRLDMLLVKYSLSSEQTHLTAVYTTPQYLDDEYRQKVEAFLKTEPRVYEWKSGRYK